MKIKITQDKHGRYFAQYINPNDIHLNGIGQFGKDAIDAHINLQALINNVRVEIYKKSIGFPITS